MLIDIKIQWPPKNLINIEGRGEWWESEGRTEEESEGR